MERQEAYVTAKISLHDVLNALESLAKDYPMDRMDFVQINRIELAAELFRERLSKHRADSAPGWHSVPQMDGHNA